LGVSGGYHSISHHGQQEDKIRALITLEKYQTEQFARFLRKLQASREQGSRSSLLDDTIVLFGSGMGNGNSHTNTNLPMIVAGAGFQHGQHLSYLENAKNEPLSNLYLSIINRMGIDDRRFCKSAGQLTGFDFA